MTEHRVAAALIGCVLAGAAAFASAADAGRGRRLLAQYPCGECHRIPGVEGAIGRGAANLEGFGRRSYIAGVLPNRAELLARWIVAPQALVPGAAMPDSGASATDARDMAAYLLGLE